ncbi:MAG: hypothetical protein WB443_07570 [Nitrososphaeraceae archaeon]
MKHYESGLQNIRVSLMVALEDCDVTLEALEEYMDYRPLSGANQKAKRTSI